MATAEEVALYYPLPTEEYLHTELERLQADFDAFQRLIAESRGQGRDCDCFDEDDDNDDEPCPIHGYRIPEDDGGGDVSDEGLRSALDNLTRRAQLILEAQEYGTEACDCAGQPGAAAGTTTAVETAAAGTRTGTQFTAINPTAPPAAEGDTPARGDTPAQGDTPAEGDTTVGVSSSLFGSNDDDDNNNDNGDGDGNTTTITQTLPGISNVDPLQDIFDDLAGGFTNPDTSGLGGQDPFDFSDLDVTAGFGDDGDDGFGDDQGQAEGDTTGGGGSEAGGGDDTQAPVPIDQYEWPDDIYSADA